MAKWTSKKALTVDEKVVFAKHELVSTKRQLKYFWMFHFITIAAIIYMIIRSL
jgi:hypothetical protein